MFFETYPQHPLKYIFRSLQIPQVQIAATLNIPLSSLTSYLCGYLRCPLPIEVALIDLALDACESHLADREYPNPLPQVLKYLESWVDEPFNEHLSIRIDRAHTLTERSKQSGSSTDSGKSKRRNHRGK